MTIGVSHAIRAGGSVACKGLGQVWVWQKRRMKITICTVWVSGFLHVVVEDEIFDALLFGALGLLA